MEDGEQRVWAESMLILLVSDKLSLFRGNYSL